MMEFGEGIDPEEHIYESIDDLQVRRRVMTDTDNEFLCLYLSHSTSI